MDRLGENDRKYLDMIARSPQEGLALLMDQYTGLIWKIASRYLRNPEDVKECVNETFAHFYFHRDSYDPARSSLPVYLSAIARNLSISRCRKEQRLQTRISAGTDPDCIAADRGQTISLAELRADVEQALQELRPEEAALIRMKYYGGMTMKEIAASLGIPYETAKKRQHRIIGKLRRSLLLTLLILAFLALSACTYCVLRHYDIVPDLWQIILGEKEEELPGPADPDPLIIPGKSSPDRSSEANVAQEEWDPKQEPAAALLPGDTDAPVPADTAETAASSLFWINGFGSVSSSGQAAYSLAEEVPFETEYVTGTLQEAVYADNTLKITFLIRPKGTDFYEMADRYFPDLSYLALLPDFDSIYQGPELLTDTISATRIWQAPDYTWSCLVFSGAELSAGDGPVRLQLCSSFAEETQAQIPCELDIAFTMTPEPVQAVDSSLYEINEHYSILSVPRHRDGDLLISIQPRSAEGVPSIIPSVIRGSYGSEGDGQITLTGEDGSVYAGSLVNYSPGDATKDYYDWDFGNVPPGNYTLHIPYLYLQYNLPEDFCLPIDLASCSWEEAGQPITGGSISIESVTPIETVPGQLIPGTYMYASECTAKRAWKVCLRCTADAPDMEIIDLFPGTAVDPGPDPGHTCTGSRGFGQMFIEDDPDVIEFLLTLDTLTCDPSSFRITADLQQPEAGDDVNYRWNKSLDIPVTIPAL